MIAVWWYYLLSGFMIGMIIWLLFKNTALEERVGRQKQVTQKWVNKHAATVREAQRWRGEAVDYQKDFFNMRNRWEEAQAHAFKADMASIQVVQAVFPLANKTDWTTGRWGGRLPELQALEKQRNKDVEEVHRAMLALPAAEGLDKITILTKATTDASVSLLNEAGVPEGQYLHFSAEGGVQRRSRPTEGISWDEATDFEVSPTIDNREDSYPHCAVCAEDYPDYDRPFHS